MNYLSRISMGAFALLAAQSAPASTSMDFNALAQQCASVPAQTLAPIVKVESGFSPYAIGVVGGRLARQPQNIEEAIATANALDRAGHRFSAGIGQVYRGNWSAYGLTADTVFDPCANLRASSAIFQECHTRAMGEFPNRKQALTAAYSCYYSGNFKTGFKADFPGQPSYVDKVLLSAAELENQAAAPALAIPFIPSNSAQSQGTAASARRAIPSPAAKPMAPELVDYDGRSIKTETPAQLPDSTPVRITAQQRTQQTEAASAISTDPSPYVYGSPASGDTSTPSAMVY